MSRDRTERQKAADEGLRAAILESLAAYDEDDEEITQAAVDGLDSRGALLTSFIVLTAREGFADDGGSFVTYDYLLPEGTMPWFRIIGLMEVHRQLMNKRIRRDDD